MRLRKSPTERGDTFPELMISVVLIVGFFAAIFEVNGACLRYINATKENVAAIQGVQDRLETLRSMAFTDVTSETKLTTTLTAPSNGADFTLTKVTETVTLTNYPSGSPSVTFTRSPGASVTPSVAWTGGSSFPTTATMVKANVRYNWTMTLGQRPRSEETETIISTGVKR
jgi:Tfp pilus assembly protein PilV